MTDEGNDEGLIVMSMHDSDTLMKKIRTDTESGIWILSSLLEPENSRFTT
jgi:hypothetical protein